MTTIRPIDSAFRDSSLLSELMCVSPGMRLPPSFQNIVLGCLIASLVPLAGGCASSGKRFDASKVPMIVAGKTTKAEILTLFGEPKNYFNRNASGKGETWKYVYVWAGPLGAGGRGLTIKFDKDDVVKSHSFQEH